MDRLYSRQSLIVKCVYCAFLPILTALVAAVTEIEDSFLYIVFSLLPLGCLYTVPFWLSLRILKKYRVSGLKRFLLLDALTCFVPVLLSSVLAETVTFLVTKEMQGLGITTLCVTVICLLVTLVFWCLYFAFYKSGKTKTK